MTNNTHTTYLGDGVFASFDGYHIWLDLRAQDPSIKIGLGPSEASNLFEYAESCWGNKEEETQAL